MQPRGIRNTSVHIRYSSIWNKLALFFKGEWHSEMKKQQTVQSKFKSVVQMSQFRNRKSRTIERQRPQSKWQLSKMI